MNAIRQGFARRSQANNHHARTPSDLNPQHLVSPTGTGLIAPRDGNGLFATLNDTLEPHPEASLASLRTVKLHWVTSDIPPVLPAISSSSGSGASGTMGGGTSPGGMGERTGTVSSNTSFNTLSAASANVPVPATALSPDCFGYPVTYGVPWNTSTTSEVKMMKTIIENARFPVQDLLDCFASNTECYNSAGAISFSLEGEYLPSAWEALFPHKQIFGAISCINCHATNAAQMINSVHTKFQSRYKRTVCRCVLIDPPESILSSSIVKNNADVFLPFSSANGASIEVFTLQLVENYARLTIGEVLRRLRSFSSLSSKEYDMLGTPLDRVPLSCQELDENSKAIQIRTLKQRGDLLLLLGASSVALQTYLGIAASNSNKLWNVAGMESIAAAIEMETSALLHPMAKSGAEALFSALQRSTEELASYNLSTELEDLEAVVQRCAREYLVSGSIQSNGNGSGSGSTATASSVAGGISAAIASKQNLLPRDLLERLEAEVYAPMRSALADFTAVVYRIQTSMKDDNCVLASDVEELRGLYEKVVFCVVEQLKLVLTKACFLYKAVISKNQNASRLLNTLLVEAMRRLCVVESQQQDLRLLELIADLAPYTNLIAPQFAMRLHRRLPELCLHAKLRRKAQYFVHQVVSRDIQDGNYVEAVSLLIRALTWAGVPVRVDPDTGGLHLPSDFDPELARGSLLISSGGDGGANNSAAASSQARQTLRRSVTTATSALATDGCDFGSAQIQINLLMHLGEALQKGGFGNEIRSHVASLLLFKYTDALDPRYHMKLLNTLRITSVNFPRFVSPTPVPPPLIKSLRLEELDAELAPQWVQIAGASFIRTQDDMKTFYFRGKKMANKLVWVAGTTGRVVVHLRNPFHFMLVVNSVRAVCSFFPLNGGNVHTTAIASSGAPLPQADVYDLHDLQIAPRSSKEITLLVMPPTAGKLLIKGVEISVAELQYRQLLRVPLPKAVSIPVVEAMPRVQVTFPQSEVEVFTGHERDIPFHVQSVGAVAATNVKVSVHHPKCVLTECEGCIKPLRRPPSAAKNAARQLPKRTECEAEVIDGVLTPSTLVNALTPRFGSMLLSQQYQPSGDYSFSPATTPTTTAAPSSKINAVSFAAAQAASSPAAAPAASSPIAAARRSSVTNYKTPARLSTIANDSNNHLEGQQTTYNGDALILQSGESMTPTLKIYPPDVCDEVQLAPLLIRVTYDAPNYIQPDPPPASAGINANAPTYSPVLRRVLETSLRVYESPSVVIKSVKLTQDRRYVQVVLHNKCNRFTALVKSSADVPLERAADAHIQPGQEIILRVVIAKMPVGVMEGELIWNYIEHPRVAGVLKLEMKDILSTVKITEPLEEVVATAKFTVIGEEEQEAFVWSSSTASYNHSPLLHDREDSGIPSSAEQSGSTNSILVKNKSTTSPPAATGHQIIPQFPAIKPVEMELHLSAPWACSLPLDITIGFGAHDEGAMLAGPLKSRQTIGNRGETTTTLKFEMMMFTDGIHLLEMLIHDPEMRLLKHKIRVSAEHEGELGTVGRK